MKYIVNSLEYTSKIEQSFNEEYHKKYIGKTGEVIPHSIKSKLFKNFVCLGFDRNEKGQYTEADWFHRNDLGTPSLWGFTYEDLIGK